MISTPKKQANWIDICSDVNWEDYHGLWGYQVSPGVWYCLRWNNLYDAMGEAEAPHQYECNVLLVNLNDMDPAELASALESCGIDFDDIDPAVHEIVKVDSVVGYGTFAPLETFVGDSYPQRIRAQARRYACELMADSDALDERLDRTVNRLGSTAREFMAGDPLAGLKRYQVDGSPDDTAKNIVLKMYGAERLKVPTE